MEEKVVTDLDVREGHWTTQTAHDMGGQGRCRAREHAEEIRTCGPLLRRYEKSSRQARQTRTSTRTEIDMTTMVLLYTSFVDS